MRALPSLLAASFALLLAAPAARADDTAAPVITHTPPAPGSLPKGKAFTVTAKITDESKFFPQIFFRYGPGAYEKPVDMKKGKTKDMYEATIPFKTDAVDYYLEAYDEFGNGPARAGDPDSPFKIKLGEEAPPPPPIVAAAPATGTKPAGSTAGKAAVAGGAVAASSGPTHTWSYIAGGVGLGLLTGGLLMGTSVKSQDDALNAAIKGTSGSGGQTTVTNTDAIAQQSEANKSLGSKATILTISGAVLLAGGVALFFIEGMSSDDAPPAKSPSKSSPSTPAPKSKPSGGDEAGFVGQNGVPAPAPSAPWASITGVGAAPIEGGAVVGLAGRF